MFHELIAHRVSLGSFGVVGLGLGFGGLGLGLGFGGLGFDFVLLFLGFTRCRYSFSASKPDSSEAGSQELSDLG